MMWLGAKTTLVVTVLSQPYWLVKFSVKTPTEAGSQVVSSTLTVLVGNTNTSDSTPVFLQCKIVYNFGKADQREEIYTLRLHEKDSDFQMVKLKL